MNIKTSEILIAKITQDTIVKNWKQQGFASKDSSLLGKANQFNIILRLPIMFKGDILHMLIYSKLILSDAKNGVLIRLYANITKLLLVSLLFGVVPSMVFLYFFSSIELLLTFTILISLFSFIRFYLKTLKLSEKYLSKLKESF